MYPLDMMRKAGTLPRSTRAAAATPSRAHRAHSFMYACLLYIHIHITYENVLSVQIFMYIYIYIYIYYLFRNYLYIHKYILTYIYIYIYMYYPSRSTRACSPAAATPSSAHRAQSFM